jgi:hypothetical protein
MLGLRLAQLLQHRADINLQQECGRAGTDRSLRFGGPPTPRATLNLAGTPSGVFFFAGAGTSQPYK